MADDLIKTTMSSNMHKNFIAGEWIEGSSATPDINPSDTQDVVGDYAQADTAQAERAIDAASEMGRTAHPDHSQLRVARSAPDARGDIAPARGPQGPEGSVCALFLHLCDTLSQVG